MLLEVGVQCREVLVELAESWYIRTRGGGREGGGVHHTWRMHVAITRPQ